MGLADREKRALDEIEQWLAEEDPKLAAKLNRPGPRVFLSRGTLWVLGVVVAHLVGLLALVAGVTWSSVLLTALGGVVCAGVFGALLVRAWRDRPEQFTRP